MAGHGWVGLSSVWLGMVRGLRGAMSDFPREDVVRVLEDVQAFLGRFKGSDVKETIYRCQTDNCPAPEARKLAVG